MWQVLEVSLDYVTEVLQKGAALADEQVSKRDEAERVERVVAADGAGDGNQVAAAVTAQVRAARRVDEGMALRVVAGVESTEWCLAGTLLVPFQLHHETDGGGMGRGRRPSAPRPPPPPCPRPGCAHAKR